ncbi:MAG: hypothetical protein MK193_11445 [Lentisphaeria bacterium]|nr:hypothetical protein [Lentisphaeria bacterium]
MVETAATMGRSVPEDLSCCCLQVGKMRLDDDLQFLGIRYDWDRIILSSFEILLNNQKSQPLSRMVFAPELTCLGNNRSCSVLKLNA